eukprot:gene3499-6965_t
MAAPNSIMHSKKIPFQQKKAYTKSWTIHDIKTLLDRTPELINATLRFEDTPLIAASSKGYIDVVQLLLDKGADINLQTNQGKTALIVASEFGQTEVVRLLLAKHAKTRLRMNTTGRTSLMLACRGGHTETVQLLLLHGVSLQSSDHVFVFVTISKFGALNCALIGLGRKMLSLVLSFLLYGHNVNGIQTVGLALAVISMVANFYEKGGHKKHSVDIDKEGALPSEKKSLLSTHVEDDEDEVDDDADVDLELDVEDGKVLERKTKNSNDLKIMKDLEQIRIFNKIHSNNIINVNNNSNNLQLQLHLM